MLVRFAVFALFVLLANSQAAACQAISPEGKFLAHVMGLSNARSPDGQGQVVVQLRGASVPVAAGEEVSLSSPNGGYVLDWLKPGSEWLVSLADFKLKDSSGRRSLVIDGCAEQDQKPVVRGQVNGMPVTEMFRIQNLVRAIGREMK